VSSAASSRRPDEGADDGPTRHQFIAQRAGERLDLFLVRSLASYSRSMVQRLIEDGHVVVGGSMVRPSHRLHAGSEVQVTVPAAVPSALVAESQSLHVVYEDGDVLVLDKPSGIVVHPSAGHADHTLVHGLLGYCTDLSGIGGELRPGIVHRLDRDTSGLLMVAKNDAAHASLSLQLQQRSVSKYYLALLDRTPQPSTGIVDAPLGRDPHDRQRMAVRESGKPARTRYRAIAALDDWALVVAGLETGRTHQLRVHFATLGCSIAGDPIYGTKGGPAGRLWLHAWRLAFTRPSGGGRIALEAPPPAELAATWRADDARLLPANQPAHGTVTEGNAATPPAPLTLAQALTVARRWAIDRGPSPAEAQERER